jgi:hypothetical protein
MRAPSSAAPVAVPTNPDPDTELAAVKRRARLAYLDAKRKGAAPPADKLHADTLLALDGAPPRAQVVMAYRTELLYQLLVDRLRWLDRPE